MFYWSSATSCSLNCSEQDGYYPESSDSTCTACPTDCASCTASDSCTSCNNSKVLNIETSLCETTCPDGYYANSSSICQLCHYSCSTCSGPSKYDCTVCNSPTFIPNDIENTCIAFCLEVSHYFDEGA
jgi:proprotein convertase subtilisin/kexin type 5